MTVRISVDKLGDEVRKCLERGEAVEIERDGEVVGRVEPAMRAKPGTIAAFIERRKLHEPVDEDFARDLEDIRFALNRPIGKSPWE